MIVKIQRPLMTNGEEPMALVYDQTRKRINAFIPYSMVEALFMIPGGDPETPKIYCEVEMVGTQMQVNGIVEDQDW